MEEMASESEERTNNKLRGNQVINPNEIKPSRLMLNWEIQIK